MKFTEWDGATSDQMEILDQNLWNLDTTKVMA